MSQSKGAFDVIRGYAAYGSKEDLKPWQYTARPLGQDDVELKISHCGICHTDLHYIQNDWGHSHYPMIVGHEIVGTVTATGPNVTHLKLGDRVGVGAQCDDCGHCHLCDTGRDAYCSGRVGTFGGFYANDKKPAYGGYAEAIRVPSKYAFKIPENLKSEHAAPLLCAGVTVFRPLKKYMVPGCKVGVIGIGGLGHLALQYASKMGATEVVAISSSDKKKSEALQLGATATINSRAPETAESWKGKLDVIISTATAKDLPWDLYTSLLAVQGTLILVGVPESAVAINPFDFVMRGINVTGSLIGSRGDVQEMLDFSARMNVAPWIELQPMAKCNEALKRLAANDIHYRFVLEADL